MKFSPAFLPAIALGSVFVFAALGRAQSATPPKSLPEPGISQPGSHSSDDIEFRKGLSAYNSGQYAMAMQIWQPLAEHEEPASQAGIGFMYHRGLGVPTDHKKAYYWLRKAAEHGQPEGQLMLGSLYFYGEGVSKSYIQAYAWCDLAQDNGSSDAEACRDGALQSLRSEADLKRAFELSTDFHRRFGQQH